MSNYGDEQEGDNIEFTAADIDTYTIWLTMTGPDTATTKFATKPRAARKFQIRTNQTCDLISLNNITFTDPITIIINTSHVENRNVPIISKMVIRTTVTNTVLKIRWF